MEIDGPWRKGDRTGPRMPFTVALVKPFIPGNSRSCHLIITAPQRSPTALCSSNSHPPAFVNIKDQRGEKPNHLHKVISYDVCGAH